MTRIARQRDRAVTTSRASRFYWMISNMSAKGTSQVLEEFQDRIVTMLSEQGFETHESEVVLDELVHKYSKGGQPFRRKVHLLYSDDAARDT